jgi:hypothetical protein
LTRRIHYIIHDFDCFSMEIIQEISFFMKKIHLTIYILTRQIFTHNNAVIDKDKMRKIEKNEYLTKKELL